MAKFNEWVLAYIESNGSVNCYNLYFMAEAVPLLNVKAQRQDTKRRRVAAALDALVAAGKLRKQRYYTGSGRNCNVTGFKHFVTNFNVWDLVVCASK